ncbi:MAG TPA: EAL domain-containing protein [Gemmatimonadaceae bacterium]|jgi:diguanylate cyclase (GGDEF)-like protein/PAS domain S-box-containing protein
MTSTAPDLRHRWTAVLRNGSRAVDGASVCLWEVDERGHARALAASEEPPPRSTVRELETALRGWKLSPAAGRRWVGTRLSPGQWCIAPVRTAPAEPAPSGIERRSSQRRMFDLLGLCVGLIGGDDRTPAPESDLADRERRARIAAIVDQIPAALWTTDRELRVTSRSGIGRASSNVLPERVAGVSLVEEGLRQTVTAESIAAHRRALEGEAVSYMIHSANRWYDSEVNPLRNDDGTIVGVLGMAIDVTDRERALETARRSRLELEEFFESAPVGMTWTSPDGTILRANHAELEMLGYTRDEYVGRNIASVHTNPEVITEILQRLIHGSAVKSVEAELRDANGAPRHVLISANALFEGDHAHTMRIITRDITEHKLATEQLLREALRDALTDLPNRAFFAERVEEAIRRKQRDPAYAYAVGFLDLDDFKLVNDSLGHAAGDLLLVEIAARLKSFVRPGDVIARFGGDEFTLLLEDVGDAAAVESAARRISSRLASPFNVNGREIFVTASVGMALGDPAYGHPDEQLRDADVAMYAAKAQGRSRFRLFEVAMRDSASARLGLETDLRNALDRGELRLVFQPIMALASGRVHSFEALLRWHHRTLGVIAPQQFIPLAERTGLIVPIGTWVLQEACRQAQRWQARAPKGTPVGISVNLSGKQLDDPNITDDVRNALRDSMLDPRSLALEVTESVLLENEEASIAVLERLRRLNAEIHIDDFGTGYSSLSRLPSFPLQTLKIDQSFVHRMGARRTDLEIVRSIVGLARKVGYSVVAEGVETAAQHERLRDLGCGFAQGFYYAKPLDPIAVEAFLESFSKRAALA